MATEPTNDAQAFYEFLGQRLGDDGVKKTPEELLHEWRLTQPGFQRSVRDLEEAIADMEAGDRGRPLADVADEIRRKHNFSSSHEV